jgi:predicted DNA-binding transcriptional regulator AlpA
MTAPQRPQSVFQDAPSVRNGPRLVAAVSSDAVWVDARQTRERFGRRSAMWLYRKIKNDLTFPEPKYFGRRQFFRVAELDAWAEAQATRD